MESTARKGILKFQKCYLCFFKLVLAGNRNNRKSSLNNQGSNGNLRSSSASGTNAGNRNFNSSGSGSNANNRANGFLCAASKINLIYFLLP